jgi:hypothetical protein
LVLVSQRAHLVNPQSACGFKMNAYRGGRAPSRSVRFAVRPNLSIDSCACSWSHTNQSGPSIEKSSCSNRRASVRPLSVKATDLAYGLPIEAFPSPIDVMKPKIQQGQNGSVDLVIVQSHSLSG